MKNNLKNMGFLGGLDGKESAWNIGDLGWSLGQGDPLEEGMATPTPVFLTGEFHGWRNLAGYSPRGLKELHMTEQLLLSPFQPVCVFWLVHLIHLHLA